MLGTNINILLLDELLYMIIIVPLNHCFKKSDFWYQFRLFPYMLIYTIHFQKKCDKSCLSFSNIEMISLVVFFK